MILTIDFGTSLTKVAIWDADGLVTLARAELTTTRPELGWAEQEAFGWWTSVVVACAEARAAAPGAFGAVEVLGCSGARQTFVPVNAGAEPLGRALVWSDRRAGAEAAELAAECGGQAAVRALTGVPLDAGSVAAKVAWLERHEPSRLAASDWLLTPRDLVVWRLTGELATDTTQASRSGLYDLDGSVVDGLAGAARCRLAPVVPPDTVIGRLRAVPAASLGLAPGIPVVIGAGDRQCEVIGAGASAAHPMVSWGTTANVSVPQSVRPDPLPDGLVLSRSADGGWLLEGGLSAAGSLLAWLGQLVGRDPAELARLATTSGPGARGVVAVPWLDGARAPWWSERARAGFVGLGAAHDAGDLARAAVEAVAWEVARCLAAVVAGGADPPVGLTLAGAGATLGVWTHVLTSVTGLPAERRRSGEAASAGAAVLAGRAAGSPVDLDRIDPVDAELAPDPGEVARYAELAPTAERVAATLVDLSTSPSPSGP
ncbi:MAG TPA: FGGY family carbohydrate kinase [Acidimicrobiales bacterium]|nr:FGGY family carbohydrate kinase [Acidimicrobiales bacterium]